MNPYADRQLLAGAAALLAQTSAFREALTAKPVKTAPAPQKPPKRPGENRAQYRARIHRK